MDSLNELRLENVFEEEKAKEYQERFDIIWPVIVNSYTSMFILDEIQSFPIDLLFPPYKYRIFLGRVEKNFIENIALTVINVFTDRNEQSVTFKTFTKWIRKNCRPEISDTVSNCLDKINDSDQIESVRERARKLRNRDLCELASSSKILSWYALAKLETWATKPSR